MKVAQKLYRGGDAAGRHPGVRVVPLGRRRRHPEELSRASAASTPTTRTRSCKAFKAGERGNDKDGKDVNGRIMVDIASRMTDAQMKALADYMAGLR